MKGFNMFYLEIFAINEVSSFQITKPKTSLSDYLNFVYYEKTLLESGRFDTQSEVDNYFTLVSEKPQNVGWNIASQQYTLSEQVDIFKHPKEDTILHIKRFVTELKEEIVK
jgi:hypothetical protein